MAQKKLFLALITFLAIIQGSTSKSRHGSKIAGSREIVTINGKDYHIHAVESLWQDAMQECENLGLNLISFDHEGEYLAVLKVVRDIGYANTWFWTSGVRDTSSSLWYWLATGEYINEDSLYWIPGNPNVASEVDACMSFNVQNGGWDDDPCEANFALGFICE